MFVDCPVCRKRKCIVTTHREIEDGMDKTTSVEWCVACHFSNVFGVSFAVDDFFDESIQKEKEL